MRSNRHSRFAWLLLFSLAPLLAGCISVVDGCIVEGTPIATPRGPVPVESLEPGDEVWSIDAAGARAVSRVVAVQRAATSEYLEIRTAAGRTLRATAAHPLAVEGDWRPAGQLAVGTPLTDESTRPDPIVSITPIRDPVHIVDLTVEPHRNFLAGGLLLHNKTIAMPPDTRIIPNRWWLGRLDGEGDWLAFWLNPDGTGEATRLDIRSDVRFDPNHPGEPPKFDDQDSAARYDVRSWKVLAEGQRDVVMELENSSSDDFLALRGRLGYGSMHLEVTGLPFNRKAKLIAQPLDEWQLSMRRFDELLPEAPSPASETEGP